MRHYTIYRVDLDTMEANVYRWISAESVYEAVKEQRKVAGWSKGLGFDSAWIYRESPTAQIQQDL